MGEGVITTRRMGSALRVVLNVHFAHAPMIVLKPILLNGMALLVSVWLTERTCHGQTHLNTGEDHLISPVDEEISYKEFLKKKLFVTPADYGRILIMPSGVEGETSVALYSEKSRDGSVEFKITCTKAAANLWYATSESNPKRSQNPAINVARCDTTIPQKTMEAVRDALMAEIKQRHPLGGHGAVYVDGTEIEFSVPQNNGDVAIGILAPTTKGPKMTQLTKLAKALADYCMDPKHRAKAITEIETIASSLR